MQELAKQLFSTTIQQAMLNAVGLTIVAFLAVDAVNVGIGTGERLAYLLFSLSTSLAVFHALLLGNQRKGAVIPAILWLLLLSLWLVPSYWLAPAYLNYVAADFISLAIPALLLLLIAGNLQLISKERLRLAYFLFLLIAVLGPFFGTEQNRHEPPTTLLLAMTIFWLLRARRKFQLIGALMIALVLSLLIVTSGQRTALLIWLFMLTYLGVFCIVRMQRPFMAFTLFLAICLPIGANIFYSDLSSLFAGHRVATLSNLGKDESLLTRIEELRDVALTIEKEGDVSTLILGFGHGGTYQPHHSHVKRNITAEGRVHNIHVTPVLVFFRYGFFGLLAYFWLMTSVLRVLIKETVSRVQPPGITLCIALAGAGYLLEGMMFNVLVDPLFSLVIALFVASTQPSTNCGRRMFEKRNSSYSALRISTSMQKG